MKKIIMVLLLLFASTVAVDGFAAEKVSKAQLVFENEYLPKTPPVSDSTTGGDIVTEQVNHGKQRAGGSYPSMGENFEAGIIAFGFVILFVGSLLWFRRRES
ncbi:hypothetical protein GIX45_08275 [Erwinia sp. CPCC 100877]|nr:hypothetical protein [Erwinia sp. CPCC 100877]